MKPLFSMGIPGEINDTDPASGGPVNFTAGVRKSGRTGNGGTVDVYAAVQIREDPG